jgi:hypothetical protein
MLRTTELLGISMVERKNRRRLVATIYVILLVVITAGVGAVPLLAHSHLHARYIGIIWQALFVLPSFVAWKIFHDLVGNLPLEIRPAKLATLGLSTRRDQDEPDERDVMVRNTAYFKAYNVLAWYSVLSAQALYITFNASPKSMLLAILTQVFVMVMMSATLPGAILLWTEPDVPGEE